MATTRKVQQLRRKSAAAEAVFEWQGRDRNGRIVNGETRAEADTLVRAMLRRQGITPIKVRKRRMGWAQAIKSKEIATFTRQLAAMMKAGVPLLQAFDIVGQGNPNPSLTKLINDLRIDIETGSSMSAAFRRHPQQFSPLYCNLVAAGEAAGILDSLLDRLATYMEKTEAIKSKIKSALMYPISVLMVAFVVIAVIMLFVIPSFKQVFASFGGELPAPTLFVIAMSELFIQYWYLIFGSILGALFLFFRALKTSSYLQTMMDHVLLGLPIFGPLIRKSSIARWTRTLATMFAAGVPLVEALESVGGAAGNAAYAEGTVSIRQQVSIGVSLTTAMTESKLFPPMVLQMCAIGEESGSIDQMLSKAADFFESEVDDMVAGLSSLMEPIIIVILGTLIGGIVIAMYLPIFKLGQLV
jgi:type IV pilus assembly protein PilC